MIYTGIEVNTPIKIQNDLPAKHELEEENYIRDGRKQGTFTGFQRIADSDS